MSERVRLWYDCGPGTPTVRGFYVFADYGPDTVLKYGPYPTQADAGAVRDRLLGQLAREAAS